MTRLKPITIYLILAFTFCISSVFAQPSERDNYQGASPKYIFYFIGDGMGLSQTNTAEAYLGAINNTNGIQN